MEPGRRRKGDPEGGLSLKGDGWIVGGVETRGDWRGKG